MKSSIHLPIHATAPRAENRGRKQSRFHSQVTVFTLVVTLSGWFCTRLSSAWNGPLVPLIPVSTTLISTPPVLDLPREFQQAWGQYSPYFPTNQYQSPPGGCVVTQVNLLQRHGARYPTKSSANEMKIALRKLSSIEKYNDVKLEFLRSHEWILGEDSLVPFGASQSFDAGIEHYERYAQLFGSGKLPFIRASGSDRVIKSALNWTHGFTTASNFTYLPKISVVLAKTSNNTLDDKMCPNSHHQTEKTDEWQKVFTPSIADRFNKAAPGANLDAQDIVALMSLCAFETVATESASLFCNLFTQDEFDAYEYNADISKYYYTGYGHPLGRVQGVGYVNELLARLTGEPVNDHTQTNSTLDSSPETFPLNRTFYADFSHDNEMIAIYSAIGLFPQTHPLSLSKPNAERTWVNSRLVPFSGRMITEQVKCYTPEMKTYVRILVGDEVQPMTFCGAVGDGLCELDSFVESQEYSRSSGGGDWEKCFS